MKKTFYFLLFPILISALTVIKAQSAENSIGLRIFVNCTGEASALVYQDTLHEGEVYTVKPRTLSAKFSNAQELYDALAGSEFYFESGSLHEDIDVDFIIYDIDCSSGTYLLGPDSVNFFFHADFEVRVNSQYVSGNYYFDNSKHAVFKMYKTAAFKNFFDKTNINPQSLLNYTYINATGDYSTDGITTIDDSTAVTAEMSHFSEVGGISRSVLTGLSSKDLLGNVPSAFELKQNFPNPFNPTTVIEYGLPERSFVELNVFNILGNKVASLVNNTQDAGMHSIRFDGTNLPSGMYIYSLKAGSHVIAKKMILIK